MAGKKGRSGTSPGSRRTQFRPGNPGGPGHRREEIDDSPSAVPPDQHGRVPTRREAFQVCAQLQCTYDEIAAMVGVSPDTVERRLREDPAVRAMLESGRANGRTSIRRALYRQMNEGNTAAAIWLSKQFLGMREPVQEYVLREREDAVTDELLSIVRRNVSDDAFAQILRDIDRDDGEPEGRSATSDETDPANDARH